MGWVHFALFLASLLLSSIANGEYTSTTHIMLLWLMTFVGMSGMFNFWSFVWLLSGFNVALFWTHPTMDKTQHYFLFGLGCIATILAALQHDLLVRRLFLQGQKEAQFLARMSHEIRTPLNGMLGFLQELRKTTLSGQQYEFVASMTVAAENLQQITDDILDHLKQKAGKIILSLQPERVETVISDCVRMFQGRALQRNLVLSSSVSDGVPMFMMLDRLRMQQMLSNLISNALQFTEQGSIHVAASVSGAQKGSMELRVEVKDSGMGMTPAQQKQLFSPFTQADGSITRRFGGTGIGLALVKGFAELMGGATGCISSGPGTGSTFWFTALTQVAEAPREVTPVPPTVCSFWPHTPPHRPASPPSPHTIPYHTIPYHTLPYPTIPYHTIPYSGVPPGESEVLPRRGPRAQGTPPGFFGHAGRSSHRRPPPAWVGAHNNRQPPPPPQPPQKRDSGAEGWGYSPMPRGHESTWPYTGRYTPAPPPRSRGAPVVPRAGSTPPPPHGAAALGGPRPAPGGHSGFGPEPAQPSRPSPPQPQPQGPPGLPRAGPRTTGTRASEPRCPAPPAPPVSIRRGPSRSGSAARGRCGTPPASTRIRPRG